MSVIIRLQNLPWSANATDIRQFFKGLGIPDGGVHIVGGENGDAFIAFVTDDDARKAMRLDGGKLKEIQVRLFLSSRAEMQEVIETARQTTMSLMQMQRQPTIAAPAIAPPAVLTPQSPPQVSLATAIQKKIPPTLPTQLPGLITQQMYQQQIQNLHQQNPVNALNGLPPKVNESLDLVSSRRSRRSRSRSHSYSRDSRSRSRSRSPSRSRDRYRRRSRSPRRNKGRSHRDRSDSRDRDRRRNRTSSRNDKDYKDLGRNGNDKRLSVEIEPKPAPAQNPINPMNSLYQQNVPFNSNISQYMMKQMNNPNAGAMNPLSQSEQMSAFSTNDVRTMNMNMTLQTNPLAFQQQLYNQQAVSMPAFNTFSQAGGVLQNAQQHQQQQLTAGMSSQMNKFGMNNGMGGPHNGNNTMVNVTHCVRVRNLCNLTNYSAIRKFFSGLLIPNDGIKMINDTDGNRTGQAYVRFARPHFVQLAIQRSNQKLGRNVIKIEDIDEKAYDDAIDAYRPPRRNNYHRDREHRDRRYRRNSRDSRDYSDDDDDDDRSNSDNERDNDVMCISDSNDSKEAAPFTTVLIEDLPPFTKEQDIMKLFSSYPLVHIVMAKRPKMFSSYVKFHSADDAKAAVKNTACHKITFKTVYISACSEEEFETARKEFSGELDLDIGMPKPVEENSQSSDRTAPNEIKSPNTSMQNVEYLNEGSNEMSDPVPGVSLENIPGVNLNDPRINPAKFPFLKNMNTDVSHSERIDPRTKTAVQVPVNTFPGIDVAMATQQQAMMDMSMSEVCCILIENMEYRTTEAEIVEWIQNKANLTPVRIQLLVNERNQTNGNGFIQFANSEQATKATELLDKAQFKSRVVHISLAPWQQIVATIQNITQVLRENGFDGIDTSGNIPRPRFNNNNANNRFPNNNRFNNNGNNRMQNNRQNNRNGGNFNGCIVSMTNVPYKASVDDILDFFSDFDVAADDIIRRYNDEGKPTGDARVRFESPSEARRAIDQRGNCRLVNRPVFLQLFNN
ncbi:uncharacterized protein LOC129573892 [Sitodiplosis mosellana]|uniref:uncharacterized protein LOC129573892 n=1 Tax=Sitodiplosis mosellana TaxID=263140 RepID=UPI002444DFD9|nr:uncharacterized protein LOC129573892 [Sitodiplosis mosellana]XP_055311013.1 uncharacterized protein LOC129573892 [Sitodiplosis mosellana]